MKKIILGIMIGVIISGTVGVLATTIVPSTIVTYQDKTVNTALDELYDSVNLLKTKGDAEATQILTGKKAIVKGTEVTGTMANRGNLNWNPSSSTSYTVPAGYYSGGTISSSNAYNIGYANGKESSAPVYFIQNGIIDTSLCSIQQAGSANYTVENGYISVYAVNYRYYINIILTDVTNINTIYLETNVLSNLSGGSPTRQLLKYDVSSVSGSYNISSIYFYNTGGSRFKIYNLYGK